MLVKLDSLEGCILTRDFLKCIAMMSGGLYVMIHLAVLMLVLYADSLVIILTIAMIICLCKGIKPDVCVKLCILFVRLVVNRFLMNGN